LWTEIPPGVFGHVSDVPSFPYDPDRGRAVLQESGYRRDTRPLSIVTRPGDKFFAETIQGYWTKLGVNTRVEILDAAALRARYNAGDWDFFVSNPSRAAPDQFLVRYLSTADPNFYGRVDSMIYAQRREADVEKRKILLRQLQIRLASEIPVIPVYRPYYVTGFRKGVTGDVPNTFFWLWYWELMDVPN
jgi:peptide/nickel transport system substrate-binding protein